MNIIIGLNMHHFKSFPSLVKKGPCKKWHHESFNQLVWCIKEQTSSLRWSSRSLPAKMMERLSACSPTKGATCFFTWLISHFGFKSTRKLLPEVVLMWTRRVISVWRGRKPRIRKIFVTRERIHEPSQLNILLFYSFTRLSSVSHESIRL